MSRAFPKNPLGALLLLCVTACGAAPTGEVGEVTAVTDGDTIEVTLAQGERETVRLLGVDTPEMGGHRTVVERFGKEASAFTRGVALGKPVRLERDPAGDARDAYGRALRYVFLADGTLLNGEIIAQGFGHAYTRFPFSRIDEFRRLEREARAASRGLWADARRICGMVASTRYASATEGRPTFLNLDRPHPEQSLTVVIWESDRGEFGEPERRYAGQRICVTGEIRLYKGKPEIMASDPSQIEIAAHP